MSHLASMSRQRDKAKSGLSESRITGLAFHLSRPRVSLRHLSACTAGKTMRAPELGLRPASGLSSHTEDESVQKEGRVRAQPSGSRYPSVLRTRKVSVRTAFLPR